MSRQIAYDVIADGGTDRMLVPIISWALHRLDPSVEILEPSFRKRIGPVAEYLGTYQSGAMLIFVHRDAEGAPWDERAREFDGVDGERVVPVIPVRMTEAWFLFDAAAIARAADRPSATLQLPSISRVASLPDPKQVLEEKLVEAAGGLTGRRLKQFRASLVERRINVASLIEDFSPLEMLDAFASFQADLARKYPYGS